MPRRPNRCGDAITATSSGSPGATYPAERGAAPTVKTWPRRPSTPSPPALPPALDHTPLLRSLDAVYQTEAHSVP
jgi:hypothetical protein